MTEQYLRYTYPYDIFARIADIAEAVAQRRLDGLIHYTQSFCFRQIQDRLLRQHLNLPILTIEGDRPSPLDHRTRLRLEAFVDVLRRDLIPLPWLWGWILAAVSSNWPIRRIFITSA